MAIPVSLVSVLKAILQYYRYVTTPKDYNSRLLGKMECCYAMCYIKDRSVSVTPTGLCIFVVTGSTQNAFVNACRD
ncbi:unnamed protein product [Dibothriocephalus latus]|uniref:Uncharacterized protein n=1 Tax=Dibothriocephalus latus TaxID=60516 RepID=A0A3P7LF21_DIBLA|nr:unnamed protein product [Dibothriocephalus latus]